MRDPIFPPPCMAFLHAELIEASDGRAVVRFSPKPEMENPYGLIQGGILTGMLDNIIGPAVVSAVPNRQTSTIQMNVHYLAPARAGEVLIGTAEVVRHGRTQAYIEAQLVRESDQTLLAKGTATNVFLGEVAPTFEQADLTRAKPRD